MDMFVSKASRVPLMRKKILKDDQARQGCQNKTVGFGAILVYCQHV